MPLPSLSSHSLTVLWVEMAALVFAARLLGGLARRFGQPSVVGQLVAGLILGPSVFGHVWPSGFHWFLPTTSVGSAPLLSVTSLALVLLLVVIGSEADPALIRRLGRAAVSVSVVSLAVPFAAGLALAWYLPNDLTGPNGHGLSFRLLVAGAVAVSSLPVIARILSELGLARRNFAQLALAAGTANDIFGFVVLALATALVAKGAGSVGRLVWTLVGLVAVAVVVFSLGQRITDSLLRRVRRHGPNVTGSLAIGLVGALVAAAAVQAIGVEGALGGFLMGVVLGRSRFQQGDSSAQFARFSDAFLSPLYFGAAGLRVDLAQLDRLPVLVSFLAVTVVAVASKFGGSALGARGAGLSWREGAALGIGLNGRGALQVILATGGLAVGVFDQAGYTVLILVSIVTSTLTPPFLRLVVRDWRGSAEEQARLEREEELERNVVVRADRLLLPIGGGPSALAVTEVLHCAWPAESPVTVLSIGDGTAPSSQARVVADVLEPRLVELRHVPSDQVLNAILAEAQLGYGAIGLGAADHPEVGHLLSSVVDELLTRSPVPMVVVRQARNLGGRMPAPFARALNPVVGTAASRASQEVVCSLHRSLDTTVVLAHVLTRPSDSASDEGAGSRAAAPGSPRSASGAAQGVLRGAEALAAEFGVPVEVLVRHDPAAGPGIVSAVDEVGADLVVVGATARLVDDRPFLGHTVEYVLEHCDATVVVVVLPDPVTSAGVSALEQEGARIGAAETSKRDPVRSLTRPPRYT